MRQEDLAGVWPRRVGVALILVAVVISWPYLSARWADEARTYRHVALAVDLEEWADLADAHGGDLAAFLAEVRAAGVNLLALKEVTVGRLERHGRLAVYDPLAGGPPPPDLPFEPAAGRIYLRADDQGLFSSLAGALPYRLTAGAVRAQRPYLELATDLETARELRGGFSPADLALAAELGYGLLLRPANAAGLAPADRLPAVPPDTVVLHQGLEVLGAPDGVAATAEALNERGLILGLLEMPLQLGLFEQKGFRELARLTDYRAVRVHAFSENELRKLEPADLVDRSLRGVRDRGIGVLYLKAIPPAAEQHAWGTMTAPALRYYGGLTRDLAAQRYEVGPAAASGVCDNPAAAYAGLAGAIGAAYVIVAALLDLLRLRGRPAGLLLLAAPLAVAPLAALARLAGGTGLMRESLAFAAALLFPVAAMSLAIGWLGRPRRCIRRGIATLAGVAAVGVAGGLTVAGVLAGPVYTLEFAWFRGVKVAHIGPMAVTLGLGLLAYWRAREGERPSLRRLGELVGDFLRQPLTWAVAAIGAAGGLGLLLILGRTGHTAGFQVSALEVALRETFDVRLYARPRFKEIMLGYPALLSLAWLGVDRRGRWGWLYPLLLAAAAIGPVAVVNSFSHIRTPLIVSLVRSLNGFWVGLALSAIGLAALWAAWRAAGWAGRDA